MFAFIGTWLESGRRQRAAIAVAIEAGALVECPVCRSVTDAQCQLCADKAVALGRQWLERGDARVRMFRLYPELLETTIQEVIRNSSIRCVCEDVGGD